MGKIKEAMQAIEEAERFYQSLDSIQKNNYHIKDKFEFFVWNLQCAISDLRDLIRKEESFNMCVDEFYIEEEDPFFLNASVNEEVEYEQSH